MAHDGQVCGGHAMLGRGALIRRKQGGGVLAQGGLAHRDLCHAYVCEHFSNLLREYVVHVHCMA